jgi:hypothetical protein
LLDQSDNFINQQIKSKGSKKNDDHSPRKRAVVNVPAGVWVSAEDGYVCFLQFCSSSSAEIGCLFRIRRMN